MPAVKVAEDQSKLADFQNSDFISAENRKVEFNNPTLEFNHRTARVAIELKPGTGFTSVDGATVSLVSLSADNGNPTAIKTYNASGNTYEALTAPQTVAAGKPFVTEYARRTDDANPAPLQWLTPRRRPRRRTDLRLRTDRAGQKRLRPGCR